MLTAIAWPLLVLCAAGLLLWLMIAWRVGRVLRRRPTVRAGLDEPLARHPRVSVVVPAHDEERVIDRCASALRALRYEGDDALQIIFVLDRCTDGTLDIVRRHAEADPRVTFVENASCPDGWAGKCNAARVGAERADGEYVLFTDADCFFDPDLLRASVAMAERDGVGLLSLLSTLTTEHAFERVVQPVASTNLIRMYPIERVNHPTRPRAFANGQFMLFRKDVYDAIGGHAAVKDDLLEDIAFARAVTTHGARCGVYLADGLLVVSMYDTLEAFRLGWKRIFIEACRRKVSRLKSNAYRVIGVGIVLPLIQLAALGVGAALLATGTGGLGLALIVTALAAWAVQIPTLGVAYGLCGAPAWGALLYPIGCRVVASIMLEGARDLEQRRPIPWAGKTYVLEPRD